MEKNDNHLIVYVSAGCVIKKDGRYLLVQEKNKCSGKWNLPAGRVEIGDTIEKTAIKEAKEETGYDVKLIRRLGVWYEDGEPAIKFPYEAEITGGKLKIPEEEIMDVRWFTFKEIQKMDSDDKMRSIYVLKAVKIVEENK